MSVTKVVYSEKYIGDDGYEYRHVHLPKDVAKLVPRNKLMSEKEWRSIGIQQGADWEHYMSHKPEKHIILFRRQHAG